MLLSFLYTAMPLVIYINSVWSQIGKLFCLGSITIIYRPIPVVVGLVCLGWPRFSRLQVWIPRTSLPHRDQRPFPGRIGQLDPPDSLELWPDLPKYILCLSCHWLVSNKPERKLMPNISKRMIQIEQIFLQCTCIYLSM